MKPSSSQRIVFAGFALVGVLLATMSVLGQVNAFSVFTDAIGVTSTTSGPDPDADSESETNRDSGPGTNPDTNSDTDSNDTGAGSESDVVDGDESDSGDASPGGTDEAVLERLDDLEEMVLALNDADVDIATSLTELATVVKGVSTQLDVLGARLASVEKTLVGHGGRLDSHDTRLGSAEVALGVIRTDLDTALATLASITPRVARLDTAGTYFGDIKPTQIVPRLKVDEIAGDWPLGRTSGLLDGARLKVSNSSCWSAPRGFMNVLAPQVFEGVQCVRVAAP